MSEGGDMFKEPPLRLLGFSFGAAQAARYKFSERTVDGMALVGMIFIMSHLLVTIVSKMAISAIVDVFLFEAINSCIIPQITIYHVCRGARNLIVKVGNVPRSVKSWAPFVAGMVTIPILMLGVDPLVDGAIAEYIVPYLP